MNGFKGAKEDLRNEMCIVITGNTSNHGFAIGQKVKIINLQEWEGDPIEGGCVLANGYEDTDDPWLVPFRDFDLGEGQKIELAAPELLEALEELLYSYKFRLRNHYNEKLVLKVEKAINKALE